MAKRTCCFAIFGNKKDSGGSLINDNEKRNIRDLIGELGKRGTLGRSIGESEGLKENHRLQAKNEEMTLLKLLDSKHLKAC